MKTQVHRFGFNGQENDNEISGNGNSQNHSFRQYDTRLGRYKSLDPLARDFPWNSPFAFAENDVIRSIDLEGRERYIMITNLANQTTTQFELPTAGKLGEGILYVTESQNGLSSTFRTPLDIDDAGNISGGGLHRVPISSLGSQTQGKLMQNQSPLSMGAKSAIMKDIATPDIPVEKETVRTVGKVLDYTGTGIEIVGYGTLVLGGSGAGLIAVGKGLSTTGSVIQAGIEVGEGEYTNAAISVGSAAIGFGIGKGIDKASSIGGFGKEVLKEGANLKLKLGEEVTKEVIDQKKDD